MNICVLLLVISLVRPFTISISGALQGAEVGSSQTLQCIVNANEMEFGLIMIDWIGPDGITISTDNRVTISTTSSGNSYTSSLQFTYMMEGDEGSYMCNVMTARGGNESQSVVIENLEGSL